MARSNIRAGNTWERDCVNKLKSRSIYPHVVTSRYANRARDHKDKIDLVNSDEHLRGMMTDSIQTKTTVDNLNYAQILESMTSFPGTRKVIWHRKTKKAGKLFKEVGQFAIMSIDDHIELLVHWRAAQVLQKVLPHLPEETQEEVKKELSTLGLPY